MMYVSKRHVRAVVAVGGSCRRRCDFARAPANGGVLASVVTLETGCGGPDCPWLVRVDDGQRVNITLIDFARSGDDGDRSNITSHHARDCKVRSLFPVYLCWCET